MLIIAIAIIFCITLLVTVVYCLYCSIKSIYNILLVLYNFISRNIISLKLGFFAFTFEKKNKEYYYNNIIKLYIYNNIEFNKYVVEQELSEIIDVSVKYSFYANFTSMLLFINESIVIKTFKTIGLISLVISMSSMNLYTYNLYIIWISIIYVLFNMFINLCKLIINFSKLFLIIKMDKTLLTMINNEEKLFFILGYIFHFLLDIITNTFSIFLYCYLLDFNLQKFNKDQIFDLNTYVEKYIQTYIDKYLNQSKKSIENETEFFYKILQTPLIILKKIYYYIISKK